MTDRFVAPQAWPTLNETDATYMGQLDAVGIASPSDRVLREEAQEIPETDISSDYVQEAVEDLIHKAERVSRIPGVNFAGLAHPQLKLAPGEPDARALRIVIAPANIPEFPVEATINDLSFQAFINPAVSLTDRQAALPTITSKEGCFSTGLVSSAVQRRPEVDFMSYRRDGELIIAERLTGFGAVVLQHEVDHLDGKRAPDLPGAYRNWVHRSEVAEYTALKPPHHTEWPTPSPDGQWEAIKAGEVGLLTPGLLKAFRQGVALQRRQQ